VSEIVLAAERHLPSGGLFQKSWGWKSARVFIGCAFSASVFVEAWAVGWEAEAPIKAQMHNHKVIGPSEFRV
jgi:hypothetical protein